MPYHGGGAQTAGHKPKKLNISKLGGGGPDFGSDFSRPHTTMAPQHASHPSYRPVGQQGQMLNKVQESLDNIIYSPRTPEGYQAPPFQPNMYQPAQPPPFQPNMSMSGYAPQQQAPMQQSGYRPTFEAVDSGQYSEEQEEFVPVWERRKTFQDQRPTTFKPARQTPVPKVPKPVAHHPDAPSFGTDYSKGKAAPMKWTPQRAAPPPKPSQPSQPIQSEPPVYPVEAETIAPWRNTLRSTGVKPWDVDLDYTSQQPTPRSGAFNPLEGSQSVNQYNPPAPAGAPTYGGSAPSYGDQQEADDSVGGPKVVHLQYNSPMGLYSQQNVKETLDGQTKAKFAQPQAPPPKPMKDGDRDWNASAVYRMIQMEDRRSGPAPGQAPQAQRAPPPPAPKPVSAPVYQPQPQYRSSGFEDELGVSDF